MSAGNHVHNQPMAQATEQVTIVCSLGVVIVHRVAVATCRSPRKIRPGQAMRGRSFVYGLAGAAARPVRQSLQFTKRTLPIVRRVARNTLQPRDHGVAVPLMCQRAQVNLVDAQTVWNLAVAHQADTASDITTYHH